MNIEKTAIELRGLQTVSTIAKKLNISKKTAINYAWKLRKNNYLTNMPGGKKRIYVINNVIKKKTGYSFYELLNENSKVKLRVREDYIIHSKDKPAVEEILARAVASNEFRTILASLGLFNKINNWKRLRKFAEEYHVERKVGALYDVARTAIRVKRMDKRTRNALLTGKGSGYIIKKFKSKNFQDIEKKWKVHIPFNKADLEVYKE